ncbi:MAG: hypothetical protein C0506_11110 [Anaerolinea sp.]|nr:hypothetical protein [Anaerolinea sp.]
MADAAFPLDLLGRAWKLVAGRYAAYELVLPGSAGFQCQPRLCDAFCCRSYSVNLGEVEVARMATTSGLLPARFLETENGEPIVLPMAQPFLLRREDNRCALLGDDLRCTQYHGRPDACRLYPHFVVFINEAEAKPVYADLDAIAEAMAAFRSGGKPPLVPLLLRHVECPGFTGPPMTGEEWQVLFATTYELQYAPPN